MNSKAEWRQNSKQRLILEKPDWQKKKSMLEEAEQDFREKIKIKWVVELINTLKEKKREKDNKVICNTGKLKSNGKTSVQKKQNCVLVGKRKLVENDSMVTDVKRTRIALNEAKSEVKPVAKISESNTCFSSGNLDLHYIVHSYNSEITVPKMLGVHDRENETKNGAKISVSNTCSTQGVLNVTMQMVVEILSMMITEAN